MSLRLFPLITFFALPATAQQLIVYPPTEALRHTTDFIVRARTPGGPWKAIPVYQVTVADGRVGAFKPEQSAMAYFDFTGQVEIAIEIPVRKFTTARIRPLSYDIHPIIDHRTIHLTLDQPRNLSIELDGDIFHNLQLLAGAPEIHSTPEIHSVPETPKTLSAPDTNTIYYGPGFHQVGTVHLTSNKQVYLAGGAVVEGQFLIEHAENVHVSGRGILFQSRHNALLVNFSKNVSIEGLIVLPTTYTVLIGSSQNVRIRNLKSFSAGGNNDGIDVFCSSDVLIDNVFMRNSDDCIAIYGHRWNYYGNTRNVTVRHSTLWADVAHPILVGTHGDPAHPDTLEALRFEDIDILDQQEHQIDYQGCMSLNAGDSNLIRDVHFDDIRVEDFRQGQLVNLRIMYNKKYNTAPGKGIEDVQFNNVSYTGTHASLSIIAGYDDAHPIRNITFHHLRINGTLIFDSMPGKPAWYKTSDMAGFFVGEHVDDLKFEK